MKSGFFDFIFAAIPDVLPFLLVLSSFFIPRWGIVCGLMAILLGLFIKGDKGKWMVVFAILGIVFQVVVMTILSFIRCVETLC